MRFSGFYCTLFHALRLNCFLLSLSTSCISIAIPQALGIIPLDFPSGYQLSVPFLGLQEALGRWSPEAWYMGVMAHQSSLPGNDSGPGLHRKAFRRSWPSLVPGRTNWFSGLHVPLPHLCLPAGALVLWHLALHLESARSPQAGLPTLIPQT